MSDKKTKQDGDSLVKKLLSSNLTWSVVALIVLIVICTISGLVLGVTGVLDSGLPGSILMIHAFSTVWDPLKYLVIISLLLFCTTTLMSQWYFGFVGLNYLFGHRIAEKIQIFFPAVLHDRIYYRHRHRLDHSGYCPGPAHHSEPNRTGPAESTGQKML